MLDRFEESKKNREEVEKDLLIDFEYLLNKYNKQIRQPYVLKIIVDKIEEMKKDGAWIKSDLNE